MCPRKLSGCGEAWYRAWFGSKRPQVQILSLGPKNTADEMSAVFFVLLYFVEPAASCMEIRRLMALRVSTLWAIGSNPVTGFSLKKFLNFGLFFLVFQVDHINTTDRFHFLTTGRVLLFIRSALLFCGAGFKA